MKKSVVISSNENDSYLFLTVVVTWAWNKLGWNVVAMIPGFFENHPVWKSNFIATKIAELNYNNTTVYMPALTGRINRTETVAQCARFYASLYTDGMIMTSDADMLPLSDYWKPKENEITAYGRDLSDRHYPMCYVAMDEERWQSVIGIATSFFEVNMLRDFERRGDVNSDKWEEWWQADQNFLTEKLDGVKVERVDRGTDPNTGYPIGRIDRSAWDKSLQQQERIDAHLFRNGFEEENWYKIMKLIIEVFNPTIDEINWLSEYREAYIKLI